MIQIVSHYESHVSVLTLERIDDRGLVRKDVTEHVAFDQVVLVRVRVEAVLNVHDAVDALKLERILLEGKVASGRRDCTVWEGYSVRNILHVAHVEDQIVPESEIAGTEVICEKTAVISQVVYVIDLVVYDRDVAGVLNVHLENDCVVVGVEVHSGLVEVAEADHFGVSLFFHNVV